jgi:hypothetical protein
MEHFEDFEIRINGRKFSWPESSILGKQVLGVAGFEPAEDYEILIKLTNKELEPVGMEESWDLSKPGIETFLVRPYHEFTIFVDDEPYKTHEVFMTPRQILEILVKLDPNKFYLKQILGHKEISYKNDMDHEIAMKNHLRFSTCKIDSTPVS